MFPAKSLGALRAEPVGEESERSTTAREPRRFTLSQGAAFLGVAYAFTVTMLGVALPTPLYQLYRVTFGFSVLMITVIFAGFAVGVIGALLLVGRLSDEIGRRTVLLPGLVCSALSAVAFLCAHGIVLLLVGRLLSGVSAGIFTGAATATLVDFAPGAGGLATLVATLATVGGVGTGPLLTGLLSEYARAPLRLTFWVDLVLLVPAVVIVWAMPEPVEQRRRVRLRPQRIGVPADMRALFLDAALAGFAGFAVLGLFTAVSPGFLSQVLGIRDRAVVGIVVFSVFAASTVAQTVLMGIFRGASLRLGCVGLIAGMAVFALGLDRGWLALVVAGGVIAGLGQGLSFRAGLAMVNRAAPAARRGEVASAFFVVAYIALSLPVVGVGVLAELVNLQFASVVFAGVIAAISALVLALLTRAARAAASG